MFLGKEKLACTMGRAGSWALLLPLASAAIYPALWKCRKKMKLGVLRRRVWSSVLNTCRWDMFLTWRFIHLRVIQRNFWASDLSLGQWWGNQEGRICAPGCSREVTLRAGGGWSLSCVWVSCSSMHCCGAACLECTQGCSQSAASRMLPFIPHLSLFFFF